MTVTDSKKGIKRKGKQIWRSIVTTLAAVVVFVTTYALIIPAITWEKTLICELEEHIHNDECYGENGELICGKEAHKHTDACFDAPKAAESLYACGQTAHAHTEDCYFSDGTLKCTLTEHQHTIACRENYRTIISDCASDGAVAVISGVLPKNAQADIRAVMLSEDELVAYFGADKAAAMTGYVAYDIKINVDGEEWQPDETVSVVVKQNGLTASENENFAVAHVDGKTKAVENLAGRIDEAGDISFGTDGFSLYIFYTYTVDFHYGDLTFSINGLESIRLSELFSVLGISKSAADAENVIFTDYSLLKIEATDDNDWLLTSLAPFDTNETLTVIFADGEELVIAVTDKGGGGGGGGQQTEPDPWPTVVNPCAKYLKNDKSNFWQIVTPYDGDAFANKTATPVDLDGDGKADAWLQKDVLPTGIENEFYVYLSLARPIDAATFLKNANIYVASTNNNEGLGSLAYELPGSTKSHMGPQTDDTENPDTTLYVKIDVYETATWNGSVWVGGGDRLAHIEGWREFPSNVGCNNGSIYLEINVNGTKQYLKLCNETNLSQKDRGSGNPFEITLGYDVLSGQGVFFDKTVTTLDTVYDTVGSQMEFICDDSSILYHDGTVTYNNTDASGNPILEWHPEENYYDPVFVGSQPYRGTYNNIAQLVYKVRLKTEESNFDSCADNMDSVPGDDESYKVNESATLEYTRTSMEGADPVYSWTGGEATFEVPYVRGLLYDICFKKVDEEDNTKLLPGAVFYMYDAAGNQMADGNGKTEFVSDSNGYVEMLNMPILPAYIKEIKAPSGYDLPNNCIHELAKDNWTNAGSNTGLYFAPNGENMRYKKNDHGTSLWEITNTRIPGTEISVRKVDYSNTSARLSGSQFALYVEQDTMTTGCITYNDGTNLHYLLWKETVLPGSSDYETEEKLLYGETYYLFETQSPTGYKLLARPIVFTIDATTKSITIEGNAKNAAVDGANSLILVVKNICGIEMPETGGIGTAIFVISGSILVIGSLVIGCVMGRKRERRKH